MNKEEKKQLKNSLTEKLDNDIMAIETRITNRKIQFDYENNKDEEILDKLNLQNEGLKGLK